MCINPGLQRCKKLHKLKTSLEKGNLDLADPLKYYRNLKNETMSLQNHWQKIYLHQSPDHLGWFQSQPLQVLNLIQEYLPERQAPIIDVGSGVSGLAGDLLAKGYQDLTLLDLSQAALDQVKNRLGPAAKQVRYIQADILSHQPSKKYQLWHDRACFHFLQTPLERVAYLKTLLQALALGGLVLFSTFSPQGPKKCSGLPVRRWGEEELSNELGSNFLLVTSQKEDHQTPSGSFQAYGIYLFRRIK